MSERINIADEEIVEVIEKRLPAILSVRPDLKIKMGNLVGLDLVRRDEIFAILEELKIQREETSKRFEEVNRRFEDVNRRFEDVNKRLEDVNNRLEQLIEFTNRRFDDVNRRFEDVNKRLEDVNNRLEQLIESTNRRFDDVNRRFEEMNEHLKGMREDFHNAISGVGSRWGVDAERAFRAGMRKILKENYGVDVEEYYIEDKEGVIKGRYAKYQVDLLVKDSVHILVDVKSSADDFDVYKLHQLGEIYRSMTGIKPRVILVAAYVREEAMEEAMRCGDVEIITGPRQFRK